MSKDVTSILFNFIFIFIALLGVLFLFKFVNKPYESFVPYDVIVGNEQLSDKDNYILQTSYTAKKVGEEYNVYPSVMIAQSILESDWGNSLLSSEDNNYFGIKGDYIGNFSEYQTLEEVDGNMVEISAKFRKYSNKYESFVDYAKLLRTDIYKDVWKENTTSYLDVTRGLTGLYATDTSYGDKLNELIVQYNLEKFDE